jgi:hypothetical protein
MTIVFDIHGAGPPLVLLRAVLLAGSQSMPGR